MSNRKYSIIGGELMCIFEGRDDVMEVLADDDIASYKKELETTLGIIILVNPEQVSEDYITEADVADLPTGLYIAQQLRLAGIAAPILFTSHASRKEVYDNKPDRGILNAVGHDYIQQPVSADAFIDMLKGKKALDKLELYDIQNSYCCREGIIDNIVHDLEGALSRCASHEEKKQLFISALGEMAHLYGKDATDTTAAFEPAYSAINDLNMEAALDDVKAYGERLIRENPLDHPVKNQQEKERTWEILWIDDQADNTHPLIKLLAKGGIKVILVQSSLEGLKVLEGVNKIVIVIADYRLYETRDGVRVQQQLQGYSLLKEVAESGKPVRLAALSALLRKFLLRSFRDFNIRTEVYSKGDYLRDEHTRTMLCNELIEMGDEQEKAIELMPDTAGWNHYLMAAYMEYRNHPGYVAMERSISEEATRLVNAYKAGQFSGIPGLVKAIFKYTSSDPQTDENKQKNIRKLRPYLVARRLALWLSRRPSTEAPAEITALLTGGAFPKQSEKKLKKGADAWPRFMISQVLGLRLQDFPLGMTVEEQRWFDDDLRNQTFSDVCKTVLHKMEQSFKKELSKHALVLAEIRQNGNFLAFREENFRDKKSIQDGEKKIKVITEEIITFNEDGAPNLKTFQHVRPLTQRIIPELDPDNPALNREELKANKKATRSFLDKLIININNDQQLNNLKSKDKVPRCVKAIVYYLDNKIRKYDLVIEQLDAPRSLIKTYFENISCNYEIDRYNEAIKDNGPVKDKIGPPFTSYTKKYEMDLYADMQIAYFDIKVKLMRTKQEKEVTLSMVIHETNQTLKKGKRDKDKVVYLTDGTPFINPPDTDEEIDQYAYGEEEEFDNNKDEDD